MKTVNLTLNFPPTVNSYYVRSKRGVFISKKGRLFRGNVAEECHEQSAYALGLSCALKVDVILYPPDRRTRDLDNYMKALLDALTLAKVWEDDSLVDNLNIHRGSIVKGGKCAVRISEHHGFIIPDCIDVWNFID